MSAPRKPRAPKGTYTEGAPEGWRFLTRGEVVREGDIMRDIRPVPGVPLWLAVRGSVGSVVDHFDWLEFARRVRRAGRGGK